MHDRISKDFVSYLESRFFRLKDWYVI